MQPFKSTPNNEYFCLYFCTFHPDLSSEAEKCKIKLVLRFGNTIILV